MFLEILLIPLQMILGKLFKPKIQDNSKPATLKDFSVPTADPTRKIPVMFGTVKTTSPNVIWYGDFQAQRMTQKVKTGLFSSTIQTLCFRYYLGLDLALCHGEIDELKEIWSDTTQLWNGSVTGGDFTVSNVTAFGGDRQEDLEKHSEGGVFAKCTFYNGTQTQSTDSYINGILGANTPAYRGVARVVWKGPSSGYNSNATNNGYTLTEPYFSGYLGLSPSLKPMSFVVKRIPKFVNALYWDINNGDANPADVIYEVLVNDVWGMGVSSALIDSDSFNAAAQILFNEGLGFSAIWERSIEIKDFIDEVCKYIDGVLYTDPVTGLFTLKLARNDYDISSLTELSNSNKVEVVSYSRGSIDDTVNEVRVTYIDRFNKYKDASELSQDLANYMLQGKRNAVTTSYIGVSNAATAGKVAQRDLRTISTSLIKIVIKVNREFFSLRPCSVFKFTWAERGIQQAVMRVTRVNLGEYSNGQIEIEAIQDVFSLASTIYSTSSGTLWTNPVGSAVTPTVFDVIEAPFYYTDENNQIMVFCKKPDSSQFSFNTYTSENGISGNYYQTDAGDGFTPTGTLTSAYGNVTSDVDTTNTLTFSTPSSNLSILQSFNPESITQGYNLFWMNGEFMAFETATQNIDGSVTLSKIWRGLFDTTPQEHAISSTAWFFSYGYGFPSTYFTRGSTVYTKVESVASTNRSALSSPDLVNITGRPLKPLPPANFRINSSTSLTTIPAGNIVIDWTHRSREYEGKQIVKQFTTGIAIEPRTEYILKFIKSDGTTLRTVTGLTGLTYTYTSANQIADNGGTEPNSLTVQLYSKREGLYSYQCQYRKLARSSFSLPATPVYSPPADTYTPVSSADATSISTIPISSTAPTITNNVLAYNNSTQVWEPTNIGTILSFAETRINTVSSTTSENHTTNNTWEDIGALSITFTPQEISNVLCTTTLEVSGTSADFEYLGFRFQLDGSTNSETWTKSKDILPENDEKILLTFHTVFPSVSAASHTIKTQWNDIGSNLDVTIYNRRMSIIIAPVS